MKKPLSARLVEVCAELAIIEKEADRKEAHYYSIYQDEMSDQYEAVVKHLHEIQKELNVVIDLLETLEKKS